MNLPLENDIIDSLTPSDLELLLRRKRLEMRRKEILSRYPIKQLPPPDSRYWVRIEGKQYFRGSKEKLENLILEVCKGDVKTIESIFDEYLEERKLQVASTTWANDIKYRRMYLDGYKLSKKPLKNINLDDGYEFFNYVKDKRKGDIKEKYWHNVKSFLNKIMEYSVRHGYLDTNPFEYLIVHSSKFTPKIELPDEDTVFSKEEQLKVCELAESDAEFNQSGIPLAIPLLFNTGLRDGEIIASRWCDVVYIEQKPHLYIRRIQVGDVDNNGNIRGRVTANRCKTKQSRRKVPLNSTSVKLLERIKAYNIENGFPVEKDDYIFMRIYKGDICECTERSFAGRLKKYCKEAGMEVLKSPHDVRRTALTNLWLNGVPIKIIQMIAGHSSQKQTEDYLRITEKDILNKNYMETLVENTTRNFTINSEKVAFESKNDECNGENCTKNNILQFPRRA